MKESRPAPPRWGTSVDVVHDVAAERFHVGQVGGSVTDPVEVVEGELEAGLLGDRLLRLLGSSNPVLLGASLPRGGGVVVLFERSCRVVIRSMAGKTYPAPIERT
jgi:hypothetical protein